MLTLADLKGHSEDRVRQHLLDEYTADKAVLDLHDVIVAYEHVGDYGCDSSSMFVLRHRQSGELFMVTGSHCSCHGFEDQFDLQSVTDKYLHTKFYFCTGGYDGDGARHRELVYDYLRIAV
jgi:hypothetical protein